MKGFQFVELCTHCSNLQSITDPDGEDIFFCDTKVFDGLTLELTKKVEAELLEKAKEGVCPHFKIRPDPKAQNVAIYSRPEWR